MITIANTYLLLKGRKYYKYRFVFVYLIITLTLVQSSMSQTLAFPEAKGFGRNATGGRGGSVVKVTNLNNSGAGSLREAVGTNGSKTIIFEVAGTITLTSNLTISGNTTIAGQTAPGDGILIKGGKVEIVESNVIIRHIRLRPNGVGGDAISITAYNGTTVEDVIIDHCSMSWASDENINIRTIGGESSTAIARNITIQYCLVGESPYGMLIGGGRTHNVTVYNNLFALNQDRHIRSQGSVYLGDTYFDFEQINNINYGFDSNCNFTYGHKMSAINNHWVPSTEVTDDTVELYKTLPEFGGVLADTDAYITGNTVPQGHNEYETELNPYITEAPFASSGIIPVAAIDIETSLLSHVGASKPVRDAVDIRLINHYNARDGSLNESRIFPTIAGGTAPTDSDNDGMPDSWEDENGLDKNDSSDRNIVQADGYTNLEYYLNGIFFLNDGVNANAGQDQNICKGSSTTLTASGGNTYLWSTGETTQSIIVSPIATTTYTVTAFIDGESDADDVIVNVNEIPTANAGADQTICSGDTITLTASGGTSYLWNTGATSSSINVSPNSTTTYSVTVTQNSCSDTDNVIVNVNPSPIANAGNDVSILDGETTTLTASGGNSYVWSTGETTQSISVSPTTTTTYTVTAFINGCEDSDDVVVTVEAEVVANAGEDVTICENSSTTLSASGGINYLWSTGETTQSIIVSPNTTTTYSVTVSNENSSDIDDVTVNVNPNPTANAGSDVTISDGESITLTASGGTDYLWSTGETTQSILVSPNVTTTYTVITILNGCEDSDDVVVVLETEEVVADAGADVGICEGDSFTLTATGGTDYLWSTGETTQSITVSPNSTTTYTVIVSNESFSDTDDVTVDVNPVPTVSVTSDATILEGDYITLSASGANNYEWSNGATQPNIAVSPSVTTTYVVTGYVNNCYDIKDVTVSVLEQVTVYAGEDTSICLGDEITLTATGSGADDYLWNTGDTTQSITVNPNVDTMFTVIASNELDSQADEIMVTVNICEEEQVISDEEDFSFLAYIDSRVSENILNIKLTGLQDQCSLYLFDISGKLIHTDEFDGNDGQEVVRRINTSRISDGVYVIKVADTNDDYSKSIVIK